MPIPLAWFLFVVLVVFLAGLVTVALRVDVRCRECGAWMSRSADYCHVCGTDPPGPSS